MIKCEHTYKINDSIILIFSGLSTRFDCNEAFESQINVGPNIMAKFRASIYYKNTTHKSINNILINLKPY
jgi:hypothetical protein